MRAQASIEYIILIGLILATLTPLIYYATSKSSNDIRLNQADQTVQSIAKAADNVFTAGPGNQEYIQVILPSGVSGFDIDGRDITMNLSIYSSTSNVHARSITSINAIDPLPNGQGTYHMVIKMTDSEVVLTLP